MRRAARIAGWILLALAGGLVLLGLFSLPAGGLMFALPFVFFIPGALLAVLGGILVRLGRARSDRQE